MENFFKDLRYGYRTLLRNPAFTAVAILSLALGIGANTAIFSFIDSILLRDLPVRDARQLVVFGKGNAQGLWGGTPDSAMQLFSWKQYQQFRAQRAAFDDLIAFNSLPTRLYVRIGDAPEPVIANLVSGNFFSMLGVGPAAGRFFDAGVDAAKGASPYIVLNESFWASHFNRSASAIGNAIRIGDRAYTIIGVAAKGFFGARPGFSPDFWIPLSMQDQMPGSPELLNEPLLHFVDIVGRLKPGVTLEQAQASVNVLIHQFLDAELQGQGTPDDYAQVRRARIDLTPGAQGLSSLRDTYETPLRILMIVVALVLLIACANVANLLLALATKRQKEFALRVAIGAGRARVIRQLLTESLMLSFCGGLLGVIFAGAAGRMLVHLISTGPRGLPLAFEPDLRVLAFTVTVCVATGVLFGLIPALRASRVDLNSSLKQSKASVALPHKITFGRILVSGQVALSLALLVTAGLLLHSFRNLISISTGFERESVLVFKLDTESTGYKVDERLASLYRRIEQSVAAMPGVGAEGVSLSTFNEGRRVSSFTAAGVSLPEQERLSTINYVSPGYFSVLRVPILLGRPLNDQDGHSAPPVGVVSESFAKKIFGSTGAALGRSVLLDDEKIPVRIVGIARDTKLQNVREKNAVLMWLSVYQTPVYLHNLAVRVTGDSSAVAASIRQAIRNIDPNLPIRWTTTLADEVSDSLVRERAIAQLSTFFAALALVLSAIGLYGTISFAVARRTNEIGIRIALGAERVGVIGMVLRDAIMLTAIGLAAGLPLVLVASRQMGSMLYGMASVDVISLVGSVAALSVVAVVAGYLPARRAAAVDPMVALRYE